MKPYFFSNSCSSIKNAWPTKNFLRLTRRCFRSCSPAVRVRLCLTAFALFCSVPTSAQDLPTDFWPARHLGILHDFGYFWAVNTVYKPYRWERLVGVEHRNGVAHTSGLGWVLTDLLDETAGHPAGGGNPVDTLQVQGWPGALLQQPAGEAAPFSGFAGAPYVNLSAWFRTHLSAQLYLRATTDPQSLPHFTGQPREIRRFGINAAEFDQALLSYQNTWLVAQFGRGRQIWGPFESQNVVLSANSPAYDHFMVEARYKRMKLRVFYGFLESRRLDDVNVNRYVVGHGLEYTNRKNLVIGLSEIVVLSGKDRPLDLAYLNPFLPAVEVELNDRTNKDAGTASSNAVWSLAVDWMPWHGLRLSGNFSVDEFQFDAADRRQGRGDALAYAVRAAYSRTVGRVSATVSADYTKIGTFTFSHELGTNNFVTRDRPLGSDLGSDADRLRFGVRFLLPWRTIVETAGGVQRDGERNILRAPYQFYTFEEFRVGPFPSGRVQTTRFLEGRVTYLPRPNLEFQLTGRLASGTGRSVTNQSYVILAFNAYLPWRLGF